MDERDLERESLEIAFRRRAWAKRMKYIKIIAVIIVAIIILAPLLASTREPVVKVTGLRLKIAGTGLSTYFVVAVENPNIVGVTILAIDGKAYVNGDHAADLYRTHKVDIKAGGTTEFDLEFKLTGAFSYDLTGVNKVRVKGEVTIDGPINDWQVPFDETKSSVPA